MDFSRNASDSAAMTATFFEMASLASVGMRPMLARDSAMTSWTPVMYLSHARDQFS